MKKGANQWKKQSSKQNDMMNLAVHNALHNTARPIWTLKNQKNEFAKLLTAACVRRGYLEKLHAGIIPFTKTGDYSDVKVIDAEG